MPDLLNLSHEMRSVDNKYFYKSCPKCNGTVTVDDEMLPDKTYELLCLQCGNRQFPKEMEVAINLLIKFNRSTG